MTTTQLRVATAGSVDDGKSTLIGRLLHDSRTIFEDQWQAMTNASRRYGDGELNLALLTDGLRAERQQGITIDVAYRYFSTPRRTFVLADTPGHAEYTRNMVTGASVSDVAVVLVDARNGVVEQTVRHVAISALLGVAHIVLAVNKMDLVGWERGVFDEIVAEVTGIVEELRPDLPVHALPVSALHGDNVVDASDRASWYDGPPLLELLESLEVGSVGDIGARLGVQWVVRTHRGQDHRGLAGQLWGGPLAVGDEVEVVASGRRSTVREVWVSGRPAERAEPGDAVSIVIADDLDIGHGDLVVATRGSAPTSAQQVDAEMCWMADTPLRGGSRWLAAHRYATVPVLVEEVGSRLDLGSLTHQPVDELGLNDVGRASLVFGEPIALDRYRDHRQGGSLIVIDPATNNTVAAAMIT